MPTTVHRLRNEELLALLRTGYRRRIREGTHIRNADEFADTVAIILRDADILSVKEKPSD